MKKYTGILLCAALSIILTGCTNVRSDYLVTTSLKFNNEKDAPLVTVTPDYPRIAVSQKLEGSVAMSFAVGDSGEVVDILVLDSPGEPFESAAVKALEQALYDSSHSGNGYVAIAEFVLSERNIY
ncbi:MAG: energy transducer TonB [Cellvibrionaceae bacterium]